MRFKQFITEGKKLSLEGFEKNLNIMIKKGILLYRGGAQHESLNSEDVNGQTIHLGVIPPRKKSRTSATDSNVLLHFTSAAPSWSHLPLRSESYNCTQDPDKAADFGKPALIIPSDSIQIFAYSPEDFNDVDSGRKESFHTILALIEGVFTYAHQTKDDFIAEILKKTGLTKEDLGWASFNNFFYDKIRMAAKFCDLLIDNLHDKEFEKQALTSLRDEVYRLQKNLRKFGFKSTNDMFDELTPTNFEVKPISSISKLSSEAEPNEIWFEGSYLAICPEDMDYPEHEDMVELLKEIRSNF